VVQNQVRFAYPGAMPIEAARGEWFIRGTEQAVFAMNSGAASAYPERAGGLKGLKNPLTPQDVPPRITAPASGTIIALDPDIPPARQRLNFHAEGKGTRWLMDGKEFARGPSAQWLPWPGRHVVQLADASGKVVDEIRLEVRGAGVREARAAGSAGAAR
jgi:penicillin-binding protein 1C